MEQLYYCPRCKSVSTKITFSPLGIERFSIICLDCLLHGLDDNKTFSKKKENKNKFQK